jgi:hypothetical protein
MGKERTVDPERKHLIATVDLILRHADCHEEGEGYGWGLDSKRPFGFSGSVAYDILSACEIAPEGEDRDGDAEFTAEQEEYGFALYGAAGDFLREWWRENKPDGEAVAIIGPPA